MRINKGSEIFVLKRGEQGRTQEAHSLPCLFPAAQLTRKNYMVKNLKRFRKQLEREAGKVEAAKCDFFPKTFEMPCEYHLFVEEFRKNPGITWIMKPVSTSIGRVRIGVWDPGRASIKTEPVLSL